MRAFRLSVLSLILALVGNTALKAQNGFRPNHKPSLAITRAPGAITIDASWAYELFANPKGIQGDLRFSMSRGDDTRFDIIYKTDGKLAADGCVVEMAIPFASLRFPGRPVQTWRATFWRNRPRSSEQQFTWAATLRGGPCDLCQYGTLTGIEDIKPGGALELIPAAVATQASALDDDEDPASRFRNGKVDVNTTFALSFPERRPFFQEGGDLFGTNLSIVYTRNINDPLAAVKLVQRTGRSSIAYRGARDDHSVLCEGAISHSQVARAVRELGFPTAQRERQPCMSWC